MNNKIRMNSEPWTVEEARANLGQHQFSPILWCDADRTIALLCPALVFWEIVNDEALPQMLWCNVRSWSELISRVTLGNHSPLSKTIQLWQADAIPTKPVPSIVYIMPDPGNANWIVRVDWHSPCGETSIESLITAIIHRINPEAIVHAKVISESSNSHTTTIIDPGFKFHYESKIFRKPIPTSIIYGREDQLGEGDGEGGGEGGGEGDDELREAAEPGLVDSFFDALFPSS